MSAGPLNRGALAAAVRSGTPTLGITDGLRAEYESGSKEQRWFG